MSGAFVTARALSSLAAVLALLAVLVWALRRGSIRLTAFAPRGIIQVETATSLGDRRSLAIVSVEGRRLLVGLTPGAVSLIADLAPRVPTGSQGATAVPAVWEGRDRS